MKECYSWTGNETEFWLHDDYSAVFRVWRLDWMAQTVLTGRPFLLFQSSVSCNNSLLPHTIDIIDWRWWRCDSEAWLEGPCEEYHWITFQVSSWGPERGETVVPVSHTRRCWLDQPTSSVNTDLSPSNCPLSLHPQHGLHHLGRGAGADRQPTGVPGQETLALFLRSNLYLGWIHEK